MECDCKDWKESNPQLLGFTQLAHVHGISYTGARFRFCPWCGRSLVASEAYKTMLLSEKVLAKDWDKPEEDEAWKDL